MLIAWYGHVEEFSRRARTKTEFSQSFAYDKLGRLTGITTAGASWAITYDANGNRTGVTLNGSTRVYNPSTVRNRLNSITNPTRSFTHDAAGNITADTGSPYTATYNLAGRLATLTKGGTTTTYSYNGYGQRVRKFSSTGAASTVIFVYDQDGQLLGEYSNTGAAIREYVWLESTPVAIFTPDPANAANPPLVYYVHTDHLDTPRAVVDRGDNLRWRWLAEPFGTTAPETNPAGLGVFTQNLRFPGQYADQESGLSYNYFRDYDPSIGRYVQSDPIGLAGGINTYAYVGGNPISFVDPKGLLPGEIPQQDIEIPFEPPSSLSDSAAFRECLADDPLFIYVAPFSVLPALNLKTPADLRLPGSSPFTSVDRRFPGLPGANPNSGAVVRTVGTGASQRVKFAGRYGTAAVAAGVFATSYSATAIARCACQR